MVRFTTKKIDSMTLGERMKKLRDERRLSLGEISKNTHVQVKYLEYLENGEYLKLPAQVYVKGFLKNYAVFMGVSAQSLLKQYEREQKIQQHIKKDEVEKREMRPIKVSSFVITPKIMIISASVIFVFSGFFYLYKQVNDFVSNPRLVIITPVEGVNIDGRTVRVSGLAEKNSKLFVNDQPILVNEKGEFSEDVGLREGLNVIKVVARNKFEKETNQTVSVNAVYQNLSSSLTGNEMFESDSNKMADEFYLELYVASDQTWISVESDGNLVYSGVLSPDLVQKFSAKEKISITSGSGKNTHIKINGKEDELLSEETGVVRDIIFTPGGRVR